LSGRFFRDPEGKIIRVHRRLSGRGVSRVNAELDCENGR